ncbi:hypothetical protein PSEUBRA_006084 [Kalmanozyma brasiliensis GHG001]|uniref:uncharacterized protein n=1 Tax=Kalmanozyma brasiliensis (strain GHG001) TaxID=1365824 RepID=UPI001CEBE4A9|nr:uncharacterized protein PSEUBRA_006084 [Kalmanozyma brasiliensis GHG001]KAF6767613.1 hypothetical protein PSEUBRA_006084 [Kalmanozyma brasiliensis GHG001]
MGNISSREAENLVDSHILRLARFIDSVLRSFHRKLSNVSSFFFSRVFGYDVVLVDDSFSGGLMRKDSLVCGPGNVCIVPANRLGPRQEEKRRRSERRRRAEAAAMGEARLKSEGWTLVSSAPNSPTTETREKSIRETLGEVARAPPARPVGERETVAEREKGKLWVMGNVAASKKESTAIKDGVPASSSGIDQQVWQRMHAQRSNIRPDSTVIKRRIQPRQSSKSAHSLLASPVASPISPTPQIEAVSEKDELELHPGAKVPEAARVLPPGALSLGPSPWEPCFSNPFTVEHEPLPTIKLPTSHPSKPKLSIDTHLPATPAFVVSPVSMDSEDPLTPAPGRRPSASAAPRVGLARRSFDASSLRSVDSHHSPATAIDVKFLATAAVHEAKGRRVWKGEVNKAAMQHCLSQQHDGRRFSLASPTSGNALARVKSQDGKGRRGSSPNLAPMDGRRFSVADKGLVRVKSGEGKGRRGSSPALNMGVAGGTGLRVERPLHGVAK